MTVRFKLSVNKALLNKSDIASLKARSAEGWCPVELNMNELADVVRYSSEEGRGIVTRMRSGDLV